MNSMWWSVRRGVRFVFVFSFFLYASSFVAMAQSGMAGTWQTSQFTATSSGCPGGSGNVTSVTLSSTGGAHYGAGDLSDPGAFCGVPATGNFTLTAHVSVTGSAAAEAGLEIRTSATSATSQHEILWAINTGSGGTPASTLRPFLNARPLTGEPSQSTAISWEWSDPDTYYPGQTTGIWMKLTRVGDEISLYYSPETPSTSLVPNRPTSGTPPSSFEWRAALTNLSLTGLSAGTPYIGFGITSVGSATFSQINYTTTPESALTPLYGTEASMPVPKSTWVGDSFPGGGQFMMYHGQSLAVGPDSTGASTLFLQGSNESQSIVSLATTSANTSTPAAFKSQFYGSHFNSSPGIAMTCGFLFTAQTGGFNSGLGAGYGLGYYNANGTLKGTVNAGTYTSGVYNNNGVFYTGIAGNPGASCGASTPAYLYALEQVSGSTGTAGRVDVFQVTPTGPVFYNYFTLSGVTSANPATALALDPTGAYLWAITTSAVNKYTIPTTYTGSAAVSTFIASGLYGGTNTLPPAGIAVASNGYVYVTNPNSGDQRVHVYNSSGNSAYTLGRVGGILAETVSGSFQPDAFDHPEGIAIDSLNNVYVTSSGPFTCNPTVNPASCFNNLSTGRSSNYGASGMVLRKYTPNSGCTPMGIVCGIGSGNLAWTNYGLPGIDGMAIDPSSQTDAYDKFHHYKLSYTAGSAPTWSYAGDIVSDSPSAYAASAGSQWSGDPRLKTSGHDVGTYVRTIAGNKYLMVSTMTGGGFSVYRFASATEASEITIPYARFNQNTQPGGSGNALEIWVDNPTTGVVGGIDSTNPFCTNGLTSNGEESCTTAVTGHGADAAVFSMDSKGNVWTVGFGSNGKGPAILYEFLVNTASGYPVWSASSYRSWPMPPEFVTPSGSTEQIFPLRLLYDTTSDSLFLAGYTNNMNTAHTYTPVPQVSGQPSDFSRDLVGDGTHGAVATGFVGTQVLRYDAWSSNAVISTATPSPALPSANCTFTLASPPSAPNANGMGNGPRAIDLSNGLLVTETSITNRFDYYYAYDQACPWGGTSGQAAMRYSWLPGPETGASSGNLDSAQAVNLQYITTTQQYITTAEDDANMKIITIAHTDSSVPPVPSHPAP